MSQDESLHRRRYPFALVACWWTRCNADLEAGLWVILLLLAAYLLTYNGVLRVTDGQAMFVVAENLTKRASPDARQLDNWEDVHVGVNGLPYAKYPLGPSIAILPFYKIGLLSGGQIGLVQASLLLPVLATALTGGLVFFIARTLGYSSKVAISSGLLYGLATIAWVYTRDLWTEPLSALFLTLAFFAALRYRQQGGRYWISLSAASTGLLILMKTANVLLVPLLLVYVFDWLRPSKSSWLHIIAFGAIVGLVCGLVGGYNWARFGDPLDSGYDPDEVFSTPLWEGSGGLLFSLYKGLFWFNPVLLLAVWGGVYFWKCHRREALLILGTLLVHLVIFGAWWTWWGGESWGPRFLVPTQPLLILLVSPLLLSGRIRGPGIALIVLSIMAQLVAFVAPDTYLPGWSDEAFRTWFLPASWAISNWPFIGHLLQFDQQEVEFAWLWWSETGARHFDALLLGGLLLNGMVAGAGLLTLHRDHRRFSAWIGVGTSLVAMALLLGRIEPDPRYIRELDDPSAYQAAYDALMAEPRSDTTLILTDKRFEPYFFNHYIASSVWYTLAKPKHTETLVTTSYLLEQQGSRVALITDDLDNTLLPYAIEQWLDQRGSRLLRQTFDGKVQITVFQLRPAKVSGDPIPPIPVFDYPADPGMATFRGIASLLGWDMAIVEGRRPTFTVYWIHRGKAPGEPFFLRLVTSDGEVVSEGVAKAVEAATMKGQMMTAHGEVEIPAEMPAGDYYWQVGIYTAAVESGELVFDLPPEMVAFRDMRSSQ